VAVDIDPLAPALKLADRPYIVPRLDQPEYPSKLLEILRRGAMAHSTDKADCTYCDYQGVCGHAAADHVKQKIKAAPPTSPLDPYGKLNARKT
jgi:hypothetical protein